VRDSVGHGARRRSDRPRPAIPARRPIVGAAMLLLAAVTAACSVGSGTLRIAPAEERIVAAAEAVVRATSLDVPLPLDAAPREQCRLRTGDDGLRSRLGVRAEHPDPASLLDLAAAALVAEGFAIVASGVPGTLLAQSEGITVTVGSDGRAVEIDAVTGCRPR